MTFLRSSRVFLPLLAMLVPAGAWALEGMSEDEMAAINAQDGLEVNLATNTVTATRARIDVDNPNVTYPGYNAYADLEGLTLTGVNADGTVTGSATTATMNFDVGANSQTTTPGALLQFDWTRTRFRINAIRHQADATKSFGSTVFDSSGSFSLFNTNGLFDLGGASSTARLIMNNATWYYRQNSNEFIWSGMNIDIGFSNGTFGISPAGISLSAARVDFNAAWNIGYRPNPATPFISTAATTAPYMRYGWAGGLDNVAITVGGGGVWVGAPTNRTQGINLSWRADAASDFAWIIGDANGTPALLRFTDWAKLPGAPYGFNAPNITLDVINAGQGPGGFLYKGFAQDTPPDAGGFAVVVRDFSFLNYNRKVELIDNGSLYGTFNWGLIYTFGDADLNLYAYPGGKAGAPEGVRFDLTLGVQSPLDWTKNSHFLIADTDVGKNVAVGFVNTNFLVTINDGYLTLLPGGAEIETTTDFRWRLDAQFGGGLLSDLSTPVRMFDLDLDLHASSLNVLFQAPPVNSGLSYIAYQWDVRLNQSNLANPATADSFIAISEPSRPTVKLNFGEISGDLEVRNGRIDLRATTEAVDGYPRLAFEQDLRFGLTGGTQPVIINNLAIGTNKIGSLAIPGGNWYGAFALKQQL